MCTTHGNNGVCPLSKPGWTELWSKSRKFKHVNRAKTVESSGGCGKLEGAGPMSRIPVVSFFLKHVCGWIWLSGVCVCAMGGGLEGKEADSDQEKLNVLLGNGRVSHEDVYILELWYLKMKTFIRWSYRQSTSLWDGTIGTFIYIYFYENKKALLIFAIWIGPGLLTFCLYLTVRSHGHHTRASEGRMRVRP